VNVPDQAGQLDRIKTALADRYAIERELGAGGMATVYLARDLKHDRKVALKVLRPELAAVIGADRFLNEIKVTANLQHPHILPLHDSGDAGGFLYYVMPFIEGESLHDTLHREKQLAIDTAIEITCSVAAALDYAHRRGVIHRDIKPENILLHDGQALVADFGIALAISHAGASRLTETGLSIGTPQYMSPEQAMGDRELDARSDVYSLGAMLYEMLTGEPPFTGPTAQSVVAKVITDKPPPVTRARPTAPIHVEYAIGKALEKLPADRFSTTAEFAEALVHPPAASLIASEMRARTAAGVTTRSILRSSLVPWSLFAAAVLAIAVLATRLLTSPPSPDLGQRRYTVALPPDVDAQWPYVALGNDGRQLIASAARDGELRLFRRPLEQLSFEEIPNTRLALRPFLSPDGEWVVFLADPAMRKVPVAGGPPIVLDDSRWGGGSWHENGTIVYPRSYRSGLWRISAEGGEPEMLTAPDTDRGELAHWWPQHLPDGKHVLFTAFRTPIDSARIEVLSLEDRGRHVLIEGAVSAKYVPTGHLMYAREDVLFAVPFDVDRLEVTGRAVPVVEDVAMLHAEGYAAYDVSADGTLVYMRASVYDADRAVMWVSRSGEEGSPIMPLGRYDEPTLSPDGERVALTITEPGGTPDLWVLDLARATRTRLTSRGGSDFGAVWTPSGDRLIYVSERPVFDIYWLPADGRAPGEPLVVGEFDKRPASVTPDGSTLLFAHDRIPDEVWSMPLTGDGDPQPILTGGHQIVSPVVSPDGRWLAYVTTETGRFEVYLSPYPDVSTAKTIVSARGGEFPRWTRGGRELVYREGRKMLSVAVDPATGRVQSPVVLFEGPYLPSGRNVHNYDVTPDGERFLMIKSPDAGGRREFVVVLNWFEELRVKAGS
jgi:serine/threonine-protein kinase